jgi:histidyl-tRNA synthetase
MHGSGSCALDGISQQRALKTHQVDRFSIEVMLICPRLLLYFTRSSSNMAPTLKNPKGMRDIWPACHREAVIQTIGRVFRSHGARSLDTPVCELTETLTNKYGEESKLIYDLKDQGGEALSLRYDLTVPFARFLAQNKIQAISRYQIGKVYRRDNPSITKGRFREFYQCDIDFAGKFDNMMADAKCLKILCEILDKVHLPFNFSIKVNHRAILSGMFQVCGVPPELFKPICSSIDKLDKMSWEEVKQEMCKVKGLDEEVADKINTYVSRSGDSALIDQLLQEEIGQNQDGKKGLEDMKTLYKHTDLMGVSKNIKFDLSLARGLDYYTGLIFEAVIEDNVEVEVGSIAAGGRYDNLVSDLMDNPNFRVPIVGLSVGIERLFAILDTNKGGDFHCAVGSIGEDVLGERYKIVDALRKRGFFVKDVMKVNVKPLVLYQTCEDESIPYAVFFGRNDMKDNVVCLRDMSTRKDEKIPVDKLADHLMSLLNLNQGASVQN